MAANKKKPEPYEMSVVGGLIGSPTVEEAARWIPVSEIKFSLRQPRRYFSPEKMEQLTASVIEKGILEPLLVRPKNDGCYEVVAGERRLRASQTAGLEKVPCVVKDLTDSEAFEIAIVENLQRDDLNPIEETEAILDLLAAKLEKSREEVMTYFLEAQQQQRKPGDKEDSPELKFIKNFFKTIGRFTPNSFRSNRLTLLKLPADVFEAIAKGQIEYSKGQLIARGVKDTAARQALLQEAIKDELSKRTIELRIRDSKPKASRATPIARAVARTKDVMQRVSKNKKNWKDTAKRKQLEHHLSEIEKLLEE